MPSFYIKRSKFTCSVVSINSQSRINSTFCLSSNWLLICQMLKSIEYSMCTHARSSLSWHPATYILCRHAAFYKDMLYFKQTSSISNRQAWIPWTCHSVTLIVLVDSHQRWKQTRNCVCFHLWCELTLALWCHSIVWSIFFMK